MFTLANVTWLNICIAGAAVYVVKQVLAKKNVNPAPYPPGPPAWPLIGNILDMPRVRPWLTFTEWGKKYGEISHADVLGQHYIVLNSTEITLEMLDKKSSIYSDRPVFPMGGELVRAKYSLPLLPYGDIFRWNRKIFHSVMGSRSILKVHDVDSIEEIEARRFLKRVLANPESFVEHIRHTTGSVALRLAYGYEVQEKNDPFIDYAERQVEIFTKLTSVGAWMVDMIPSLAKLPAWFPGAGFKRKARKWNARIEEMIAEPFQFAKDQMAAGTAPKSLASRLLEGRTLSAEEDYLATWCAAALYGGGTDTTVSSTHAMFLAMTLFPDVQRKAQAEIDAIVGPDRLPSFTDRESLPYVNALVTEVLRWHAIVPVCVPHRVMEDDIHAGYYIPKGSWVLANISFMLNDPQRYPNPSKFKPERYLAVDGKEPEYDPRQICFGFGRRACPGLHLADLSLWLNTVMTLAVFSISKAVENGVEITPVVDQTPDSISHPMPFKCSIRPRSAKAIALIQQDMNY